MIKLKLMNQSGTGDLKSIKAKPYLSCCRMNLNKKRYPGRVSRKIKGSNEKDSDEKRGKETLRTCTPNKVLT